MSFVFYPYNLSNNIITGTVSSQQLNLEQLKLAPYLPQLEQQANLELSKTRMALAEQDNSIYASNRITETMTNSVTEPVIGRNILAEALGKSNLSTTQVPIFGRNEIVTNILAEALTKVRK